MSEPPTVPILLVDDTRANLVAFDAVLSCDAYEIVAVTSGEEAIREVARRDFAVVLLDVQMPTMDGFETAQRMRDVVGRRRPVPIVFVSGIDCEPARVLRAYAGGGVDFVQKPFHPDVLRAKVAIFADLHRARARVVAQQAVTDRALHGLTELALALSETRTRTEVADVIVDRCMTLARADACFLYLLDEAGGALELIGQRGIARDVADAHRRLTPDIAPSAFGILRAPSIVWAETAGECEKLFPRLVGPETPGEGPRAFWSMPLLAEGRAVGLLGMGFHAERSFDPEERSLVATLGKQCAQALLRAVRLDGEERAKAWLSTTLRSIGDAVIAADEGGRVRFMNPAAEQLTGWTESEARGCALANVFSVTLHESIPNGALLRSRTGAEIPVAHTAAPIEDDRGGLRGTVLVFRDVTAEANDRERSQAKRQELERVNRAKDEFLATMSHELRTPLNAITGWTAILRRKPRDPSKLERGLEVIERNALTQSRLVSDLLEVSRIISGKLQLTMRTMHVAPIVHAAADVVRSAADAKRVRLLVDVDPAIGESVADPDRLQQIIWNLLTNAVRFTPAGGRVIVTAERAHSAIEIRV
ncbi:MAG TPA: response regulator, partial [Polyangiaceae bacterium]